LKDASRRLRRFGKLDLEHVVVEQVIVAAGLIQFDAEKILSQPGPIVGGVVWLCFLAHGGGE
jgi:hypothetical protein